MPITVAVGNRFGSDYLLDGSIQVPEVDVELVSAGPVPSPIFNAMVTSIPYDVGELAISHYVLARDAGVPLMGIPIFPSRFFPQLGLTTHRDAGIHEAADLIGKRVGVAAGLGSNPAVWIRGMLLDMHDVPWEAMAWVTPPTDSLNGVNFPVGRRFSVMPGDDLQKMLENQEIDALVGTGAGQPKDITPRVLSDPYGDMDAFVQRFGFFPINTTLVAKPEVLERHPQLVPALMEAFNQARSRYHQEVASGDGDHQGVDLPWLRERQLMPDANGLDANRAAIRYLIQCCYSQGMSRTLYEPEDLFVQA
ncbi:MAG: ABC transporter substrate-binding protein [Chloroflexota bacterium]